MPHLSPWTTNAGEGPGRGPVPSAAMSKKTDKRKIKARRNKANHGRKPNAGRG